MAKWAKTWHSEATADVLGLANIRSLRSRAVLEGPSDLLSGLPAEFAPLREASTALVAMTAANEIRVKVQLAGQDSGDAKRLDEAMKIIIDFSQVGLSLMRVEASSKSDTKGASQLELLDQLDAVLDTVGTKAVDNRLVEAATVITAVDAAKIAGNIVALFAQE